MGAFWPVTASLPVLGVWPEEIEVALAELNLPAAMLASHSHRSTTVPSSGGPRSDPAPLRRGWQVDGSDSSDRREFAMTPARGLRSANSVKAEMMTLISCIRQAAPVSSSASCLKARSRMSVPANRQECMEFQPSGQDCGG